jgi:hypothetical protein
VASIKNGTQAISAAFRDLASGLTKFFPTARRFACDAVRAICRMGKNEGSHGSCCIDLPPVVLKRADPLIYDQYYLMSMGLAVTWDNPDVQLFRGGVLVSPSDLQPATDYEVRIRAWNGSYDAPAIGLPVELSFLSFGIGATNTAVGSDTVDLGPKASATAPAFASITWTTPPTPGHYCLQARLVWPDDANPSNNLGQKNTQVVRAHSPAVMDFAVRNDAGVRREFHFEADSYVIPPVPVCPPAPAPEPTPRDRAAAATQGRLAESKVRWAATLATQGYGRFPLGPGWTVAFEPSHPSLGPDEQINVRATIEPPAVLTGRHAVNVHGFARPAGRSTVLAGGVTLLVERS